MGVKRSVGWKLCFQAHTKIPFLCLATGVEILRPRSGRALRHCTPGKSRALRTAWNVTSPSWRELECCGLITSVISCGVGDGDTIEETTNTLAEWGIRYILWLGAALGILAILLDPWRKTILNRVPDWCNVASCIVLGLACNWDWAYWWFSQRFALTSAPVLGRMALFVTLNAAIGLLAALLHDDRKWQLGAAYFSVASVCLSWFFHG